MLTKQKNRHSALESFIEIADLPFFILDREGLVKAANQFSKTFCGPWPTGSNFKDLLIDFDNLFALEKVLRESSSPKLLHLKGVAGLPQSFYFTFIANSDEIFVFGQTNFKEVEEIREQSTGLIQELSNLTRKLQKQKVQLAELNREKNNFLGMAAHDLRKPLSLIIAYSEFIASENRNLSDEHIEFLNIIRATSLDMARLIDNFLNTSLIEAGHFKVEFENTNFNDLLQKSLAANRIQAAKKGVQLKLQEGLQNPQLLLDRGKIEQVIGNLVGNAIEHSDHDEMVTVSFDIDSTELIFRVKDRGCGLTATELKNLAQPFSETSGKKTAGEPKTGLGLQISRKIIEAHKGRLWLESQSGKGTSAFFSIPLKKI